MTDGNSSDDGTEYAVSYRDEDEDEEDDDEEEAAESAVYSGDGDEE